MFYVANIKITVFFSSVSSLLLSIFLMRFMIYDFSENPDVNNYMQDYLFNLGYYEPAYRLLVFIHRELLNISFENYWYSLLFIQTLLIYSIYNRFIPMVLVYIVFVPIAESYLGTQVRYSISVLLFLTAILRLIGNEEKWDIVAALLVLFSVLMHVGAFILLFIYYSAVKSNLRVFFYGKIKWQELLFYTALIPLLLFGNQIILYLMQFTRFIYFEEGSIFLESRSAFSIIYMLVSAILIRGSLFFDNFKLYQSKVLVFSYFLLISSLMTATTAVLSARIFAVYVMLQPLIISFLILNRRAYIYGLMLLVVVTVQLYVYLVQL